MAMNRAQRRKMRSLSELQSPRIPMPRVMKPGPAKDAEPDFSSVPLATVCESIWLVLSAVGLRGAPV